MPDDKAERGTGLWWAEITWDAESVVDSLAGMAHDTPLTDGQMARIKALGTELAAIAVEMRGEVPTSST